MASLASPVVSTHAAAATASAGFLPAAASRSRGAPRLLSPLSPPSASPLFSSASARFPHSPRAPCSAARHRRRDTVWACSQASAAGPAPLLKTLADLTDSLLEIFKIRLLLRRSGSTQVYNPDQAPAT